MSNPHVLVIPYPAQGHVIPLMELSQCLAKHGCRVTFVNTEHNHKQVIAAMVTKDKIEDLIQLLSIPDGVESPEDRKKTRTSFESFLRVMPGKLEELLEQINASETDKIACVLADQSIGWAMELAEKKGIRRAAFCPAAAAMLVLGFSIPKLINDGIIDNDGTPAKEHIIRLSSTMPAMSTSSFVWTRLHDKTAQKSIFEQMVRNNKSTKLAEWLLCNSTYDLEPAAFTLASDIKPIGPLLASNRLGISAGNFWPEDLTCLKWLDQQPLNSVIYIAFGSSVVCDSTQFQELALGLELSNKSFLWVVHNNVKDGPKDVYPEGFRDRVATRGQIVNWAPQQTVLAHPSVTCFISHCGWNSTVEGLSNGVPFLCWPCYADQFVNESYICDVWKVGLGFNRNESGIITREEINSKVEKLLGNEEYKARASDLKQKVMNSVKEGGDSYNNFKKFVEWVRA